MSETGFDGGPDSGGVAAGSVGKIGTISPTDPERWMPLDGGLDRGGVGAAEALGPGGSSSSVGTGKTLRQAALGQRTI